MTDILKPRLCSGPAVMLLMCIAAPLCWAQPQEAARIEQQGDIVQVTVDSPRPVEAAAKAVGNWFGISICVEDPILSYSEDLKDASLETSGLRKGTFVPRGGSLEFQLSMPRGSSSPDAVMTAMMMSVNTQLQVKYRLDREADRFVLVPVRIRNRIGRLVDVRPLLDFEVSIPYGARSIAETAALMAGDLSKQTGLTISCCQSLVAGIPWGMDTITFGTPRMPAREVLKLLIREAGGRRLWVSRCDLEFCFIDLY
ncbi:MAG: hypothetical protein ACRD7E_01685 [Bryobacteraceae bacterium]